MEARLFFSFDVESIGVHGDPFAVGWVVVNDLGQELESGYAGCALGSKEFVWAVDQKSGHTSYVPTGTTGTIADLHWVMENVIPTLPPPNCASLDAVYSAFWKAWSKWASTGAVMVTDVGWPIEAKFLLRAIAADPKRKENAPYPVIDVASVALACGRDPLGTFDRLPSELPAHNPVNDARQSVRILLECLSAKTEMCEMEDGTLLSATGADECVSCRNTTCAASPATPEYPTRLALDAEETIEIPRTAAGILRLSGVSGPYEDGTPDFGLKAEKMY